MTEVILYGNPLSTYTRTARLALAEKGVDYTLEPVDHRAPEYRKIHPFARIPAMRHGDFVLYETLAICTYVDDAFEGPPLMPSDARARARAFQWVSATLDYLYPSMVRKLVFERLVAKFQGRAPNEALVREGIPEITHQARVLQDTLARAPYLAGEAMSIADMFLLPVIFYVNFTAEGQRILDGAPALGEWLARMSGHASVEATMPPVDKLTA
jgi:glutathione S-transferase